MERRLWELDQTTAVASAKGNFDADAYMHGMANGLILAQATMQDQEPAFLEWPQGKEPPQRLNYRGDALGDKAAAVEPVERVPK